LEAEDNILRLDRTLAELFQFVDEKVGLDKTLIVLSGDHGGPEAPEYMASLGLSTGRFAFDWFKTEGPLTEALQKKFGRNDLIAGHSHPYLYLNLDNVSSAGLDLADVERFIADELMKIPGIAYALTRGDLLAGRITCFSRESLGIRCRCRCGKLCCGHPGMSGHDDFEYPALTTR
jgi:hypothetical protein